MRSVAKKNKSKETRTTKFESVVWGGNIYTFRR